MLKVVVFDVNGVVWKSRKFNMAFFNLLAQTVQLHPKTVKSKYLKSHSLFQLGKLNLTDWLKKEFELTIRQLESFDYQLKSLFEKPYSKSIYPQALPLIRQLQQQGVTVGCLSNMPNFIADLFVKAGFFCHFDFKLLSSVVGVKKPNQKIYKKIFSIGKWLPSQVLIIDNEIDNISVAQKMGFATHHFRSYRSFVPKLVKFLS